MHPSPDTTVSGSDARRQDEQPQDHLAADGNEAATVQTLRKYTNDKGEVAVLFSPGYGAGWSTWNCGAPQCLFEPEVVQWVLDGKPEDKRPNVEDGRYGEYFYAGGMDDLDVAWLASGTRFRINEYDGYESLVADGDDQWSVA
jgi:hypothetical protein